MSNLLTNDSIKDSVIQIINKELKKFFNIGNDRRVNQLLRENYWTDMLQTLVDFGNSRFLKNFKYRLEMEEMKDIQDDYDSK
jgi:hypothetical protein